MAARSGLIGFLVGVVATAAGASAAHADGEAGLVVQDGDTVRTFCVAFSGDGISGDQLLKSAGQTFDAYGSGGGLAVCAIEDQGCPDSSSFASCFCKCQGSACTYWAFFTRSYGKNWVYSSLAFNLLKARDGDVHGWKWGAGGPNSAPVPQDITFDQICGHAPRGGAVAAPATTAAATSPPAAVSVTTSPGTPAAENATLVPSPSAVGSPLVTISNSTAASSTPEATSTPSPVESSSRRAGSDTVVAFGSVVGILLVAIAGTGIWRARRG